MTITSIAFVFFVLCCAALYYILPRSLQWVELVVFSIAFYFLSATPYTIIYLVVTTAITYISTIYAARINKDEGHMKAATAISMAAILVNIALWFFLKAKGLWLRPCNAFLEFLHLQRLAEILNFDFIAALGMGYYTLQAVSYILDCYWKTIKPQRNPLKLFLFIAYFPQLVSGPISRYAQLQTLYERHSFCYENVAKGCQRMLWGIAKKLVLAERMALLMQNLSAQAQTNGGLFFLLLVLAYPIQMYADFSGCMDIVLGVSQIFGIALPENFKNPFFAKTTQEFWQRWHITLGSWAKDYVLYPLLKSKWMIRLNKYARSKLGKKKGRLLVTSAGMIAPWFVIGVWHGEWKFVVGVSLWYWCISVLAEICTPLFQKIISALKINTQSFGWKLFQMVRTYVIYCIGSVFFRAGVIQGFSCLKQAFLALVHIKTTLLQVFDLRGIFTEEFLRIDWTIIVVMIVALFIVGVLREKHGYAREWINRRSLIVRWGIWFALIFLIVIYGKYGPGYNAADFIYQGF